MPTACSARWLSVGGGPGGEGRARSAFIVCQDARPLAVVKLDRSRYARLMCGRFQSTTSPAELARLFTTTGPLPNTPPRYNAAPTQDLPIVLHGPGTGNRPLLPLRWGVIP